VPDNLIYHPISSTFVEPVSGSIATMKIRLNPPEGSRGRGGSGDR
jgi:hypothetical protein